MRKRNRILTEEQKARKKEYDKEYYTNYKEKIIKRCKEYRKEHKEKRKEYNKEYYKTMTEEQIIKKKEHHKEYIESHKEKRNEWYRNKRANDPNFKIEHLLRNRVLNALKGITKSAHTMKLVGCNIDFAREHLQKTAVANGYSDFDVNNWTGDEYHIDHIIPCSSFDLTIPANQFICFNWKNLQILSAYDNMSKGDKLIEKVA